MSTTTENHHDEHEPMDAKFAKKPKHTETKSELYKRLNVDATAVMTGEKDLIANTANVSSLLYHELLDWSPGVVNWVGFYLLRSKNEMVLGPFHGKVACIRIKVGRGVCGTTVKSGTTTVVPDVHKFPGHIACDSASNSEIVIPIFANDKQGNRRCVGVLDIDSPRLNAMDQEDKLGLEPIVEELSKACDWSEIFAQQDKS